MSNNNEIIENSSEEILNDAPKRKRTRMVKKDAVYTVSGMDGESLDSKAKRKSIKKQIDAAAQKGLFDENFVSEGLQEEAQTVMQEPEVSAKETVVANAEPAKDNLEEISPEVAALLLNPEQLLKPHRGRRSKAEIEALAIWEAQQKAQEEASGSQDVSESQEVPESSATPEISETSETLETPELPETSETPETPETSETSETPKTSETSETSNVPEDCDFIIIQDIPVEDFGVLQNYNMYDGPTEPPIFVRKQEYAPAPVLRPVQQAPQQNVKPVPQQSVQQPVSQPVSQPVARPVQKSVQQKQETVEYRFENLISASGVLEMMPDGYGFLRSSEYNYVSSPDDVYVAGQYVKQFGLKTGDVLECKVRPPFDGEKFFTLTSVDFINGRRPEEVRDRIPFEHLTPLFPDEKFTLCGDPKTTNKSTRIVDLFSPIGKGQRALIVAQPKTGKTILMKDIANAIAANHPEAYLMMLLIDERPEEVTDMARTVNAEVIASTFDEPADKHVKIANLVLEKAKRLVECGHDVVIFLDSITRLARAYNTVAPASGKVLTGGVDANALQKPKRFFGAARNIEGGGSLTIIATALIDTGSKMDEVIFEEFKGTGNMELQLDRSLANKRVFPAVNLVASSTRRDDLLLDQYTQEKMWVIRKFIADMNPIESMTEIQRHLARTRDNSEFFMSINS